MLGHLPERDRPPVKARMRRAWRETDYPRALEQLTRLADELQHTDPGAAGSLTEGMEETLTVIKFGIKGKLRRTLESTNACESMIDTVRTTQRNVKHWSSGEMGMRWTAAEMLEAEKQFRKVIGYTELPRLAIERRLHLHQPNPATTQEAASAVTVYDHTGTVVSEVLRRPAQPLRSGQPLRELTTIGRSMNRIIVAVGLLAWLLARPALAGAEPTVVSIEFDDGLADAHQALAPLKQNGLHATFYINSGRVGSADAFMTWPQIHDLANAGNEIGGHTVLHANLSQLDPNEQTREICDDRSALIDQGFQPTDFAYPYGAGAQNAQTRAIVEHCGYNGARDVWGVLSPNYGCYTCAYAETIPPKDYYATRAPQSILNSTSVREVENYVTQAQQHGGGWVQLVFHHICNFCNPYAVSLPDFDTLIAWLVSQRRQHLIVVKTVKQVIGGPFKRGVQGPAPPVPPSSSNLVWNPWFNDWNQVTISGEGSSTTTEPVCFQAGNWGHNNVTLTRVKDSPPVDPNGYSAQLQVTGYTFGAAEIITTQLDLGACNPILKNGEDYRIAAWYKSDAPANIMLFARNPNGGWRYWTEGPVLPATSTWTQATLVSPPLPKGDIQVSFGIGLKSNGTLRVDGYTLRAASAGTIGHRSTRGAFRWFTIAASLAAIVLCIGVGVDIWYHRDHRHRMVKP